MKSPREIKTDKINVFKEQVEESKAIILTDYKGLTVDQMEELRMKLREAGGKISVIKNTLAKVALNEMGIDVLDEDLQGQVAFVFSKTDAVSGTKIAHSFAKSQDKFQILSGLLDGKRLVLNEVKALAMMPGRDELQGMLVGILIAPLADMVGTFQAPYRDFIGTLDAYATKIEGGGEAAA